MRITRLPFAGTVVILLTTIGAAGMAARRIPEPLEQSLTTISDSVAGWKLDRTLQLDAPGLKALAPTEYLLRKYQKNASELDLFISFYAQQRAGESMHSPKHCLPGAGWEIWEQGSTAVDFHNRPVTVNKYVIEYQQNRMLMLYWYQTGQRVIASEYLGKVLLARDTLLTGRTAGSIVRITVPYGPDALKEATAFAAAIMPEVERCFRQQ
jgi:EpsI family protein